MCLGWSLTELNAFVITVPVTVWFLSVTQLLALSTTLADSQVSKYTFPVSRATPRSKLWQLSHFRCCIEQQYSPMHYMGISGCHDNSAISLHILIFCVWSCTNNVTAAFSLCGPLRITKRLLWPAVLFVFKSFTYLSGSVADSVHYIICTDRNIYIPVTLHTDDNSRIHAQMNMTYL